MNKGWKEDLIENIFTVSSGSGLSETNFKPGSNNVYGGNGIVGFHNEYTNKNTELIIGRVGAHCGNVYITSKLSWITDNALIVNFIEKDNFRKFWFYLLNHLHIRNYAFQSAQPVITGGILKRITLNLPPLPQQKKIAKILSTCDMVIEKTEQAIAKYQALKQGLMQDLFSRGIDLQTGKLRPNFEDAPELYKESELGMIPLDWEVKKLEDLLKVNGRVGWKGYTVTDLRDEGPLTIGAAQIDKFNKLDLKKPVMLSYEKFLESPEIMIKQGDLLIVQRGTIGKYVLIDIDIKEATINPSIVLLNNIKVNPHFLYYSFGHISFEKQILNSTSQTGVPMISQAQINNFIVSIPNNKEELSIITDRLKTIDQKICTEQSSLAKYEQIKKGLMQDLLSGEVTVSEL
ncbi:MAG: restriction endonuclease subunit S [Chitinophagales bacterium]